MKRITAYIIDGLGIKSAFFTSVAVVVGLPSVFIRIYSFDRAVDKT